MNKTSYLLLILIFLSGCSFDRDSSFWSSTKKIELEKNYKQILKKEVVIGQKLNSTLKVKLDTKSLANSSSKEQLNNDGIYDFDGDLKTISRFSFSKIENFNDYEPTISFNKNNIIFFDNKGTILQFNNNSKLIWKKNYYTKSEKKLKPILQFANNGTNLIVADNIAKYYLLDLKTGNLIWSKSNMSPFNSQIKIYKDKFFLVDFSNTLRCFSLKNGNELWKISTENSLIRSQKKLSLVIHKGKILFNNSIGDISAVDINKGQLLWQLPTQSSLIYESAFSLETSDLVADNKSLFFSNNRNQFFSVDLDTGSFNWENKINSHLRPSIVGKLLFTISLEGFLIVIEKNSGNIIRVTDLLSDIKEKKRDKFKPSGFVVGLEKLYLSTNNGRLLVIDIASGKTVATLKIDNEKISRPFVMEKNLFVIKDNAIIKLN